MSVSESLKFCVQRQPTNEAKPPYFVPLIPLDILPPPYMSVPGFPRYIPADDVGIGPNKWTSVGLVPLEDVSAPLSCEGVDNKVGNGYGLGIQQEYRELYQAAAERRRSAYWQRRKQVIDNRDDALSLSSVHTQDDLEYDLKDSKASPSLSSLPSSHEELSNHYAISPVLDSKNLGFSNNTSESPDDATPMFFPIKNTNKWDHGEGGDGYNGGYSDDELLTLSRLSRQSQLHDKRRQSGWKPELPEILVPTTIGLQLSSANSVASDSYVSASIEGHVGTEGGVPLCPHTRLQPLSLEATAWVSPRVNNENHAPSPSRVRLDSSMHYTETKLDFFSSMHAKSRSPARWQPSLTPALAEDTSLAQTSSKKEKKKKKKKKKKKAGYCRSWCRTGDCSYGLKCIYRHDMPKSEADFQTIRLEEAPAWYFLMNNLPRTGNQGCEGYIADRGQQQQEQHGQYSADSPVRDVHLPHPYPRAKNDKTKSKQFNDSTTHTNTRSNSSIDNDDSANGSQRQRQRQRQGQRQKPKQKQNKTSDHAERAKIELDAILEQLTSKSRAEEDQAEENKKQKQRYVELAAKEKNTEASTLINKVVSGGVATSSLVRFGNGSSGRQMESYLDVLIEM
ncbi:hypothetical protein Cpir12675_000264 [Ceratocystis pirilliformis]|uniref:C3H1-type domain-containing protein n=1 Tax=Ceratocystis pirilliformis TaxID=259994 RepID=A0ABR3ZM69_9PEZI